MPTTRAYPYVGPADIRAMVAGSPAGTALTDLDVLAQWHASQPPDERADLVCVFCDADLPAAWNISPLSARP